MVATSGHVLVAPEAVDAIVTRLFPLAHIITPNLPETALLLGLSSPVTTVEGMVDAAKKLAAMGPR
jgi:hydroxymethylpyrimidine/phosphomethylpyrimidine kinase